MAVDAIVPITDESAFSGARLCNFVTGSAEPLKAHEAWIRDVFAPNMKLQPQAWIDLVGYASRIGNATFNQQLSERRVARVEALIRKHHPGIVIKQRKSVGEGEAGSVESNDDAFWRAVAVKWFGVPHFMPTPGAAPSTFMDRVLALLPVMESWRAAAERVTWAALRVTTQGSADADDVQSLALVNRVFKVNDGQTNAEATIDILRIRKVFMEIGRLYMEIRAGQKYFLRAPDQHFVDAPDDQAYTIPGHWALRDPADGIFFVEQRLSPMTDEHIVDCTIHECAHFCGPMGADKIDHAIVGGSRAYGLLALTLTRDQALVNASSYAWLAFLARKPSNQWLTAIA